MRKPKAPSQTRERYIKAGLITPDPVRSAPRWDADQLDEAGFHAAAKAVRGAPIWSRAR